MRTGSENQAGALSITLLLVEAADDVRLTAKWFLSNLGYAVDSAGSGARALALFDPARHHAVITGHLSSGVTDHELACAIKAVSPATPVLAYSDQPPTNQTCLDAVLKRPAHLLELESHVAKLLKR